MNSHDHTLTGPIVALRSNDDLHRIAAELLALASGQKVAARQYARLADRLQVLADSQRKMAGERGSLGELLVEGRLLPAYDVSTGQSNDTRRAEPATSQVPVESGICCPIPLRRQRRCPGDPGS